MVHFLKCLFKISNDIINMLQSNRNPEQGRSHTCSQLRLFRQLLVGGGSRLDDQGSHITHIGQVTNQFQVVHQPDGLLLFPLQGEG